MDETNPATAATEVAVESLALWLEDPQQAINHIANLEVDPSGPGPTNLLIVGLLNLSSWLLISLAETQGEATDVELQERATDILRKLSQRLTEARFDPHATTEGGSGAK
jgi:hypothetical protein